MYNLLKNTALEWTLTTEKHRQFEQEVLPHIDGLYGYALHLTHDPEDASDLVQETYARALKARHQYTPGTNSRAWLFAILRNVFFNQKRAAARKPTVNAGEWIDDLEDKETFEIMKSQFNPEKKFLDDLMDLEIKNAINLLPVSFRTAVILCDVQGFSYTEIGEMLDIPIGTVRSRIHRGRAILRHLLHN